MRTLILASIGAIISAFLIGSLLFPGTIQIDDQVQLVSTTLVTLILFLLILEGVFLIRHQGKFEKTKSELAELQQRSSTMGDRLTQKIEELNAVLDRNQNLDETIKSLKKQMIEEGSSYQAQLDQHIRALQEAQARYEELEKKQTEETARKQYASLVSFIALLQNRGRFIDFIKGDIALFPNEQIGAAARIVHQGCSAVINEFFDIEPVLTKNEGDRVRVEGEAYNPLEVKLVGSSRMATTGSYEGTLLHPGWQISNISLPEIIAESPLANKVIAPAEIEVA
jgi:hypothetical protein